MEFLNFREIKELVKNNELRKALEELQVICEGLDEFQGYRYSYEIYGALGQYNRNINDNRRGVISRNDFNLEENKIRYSILEIISQIMEIPNIDRTLRQNLKKMMHARYNVNRKFITLDYSKITQNEIEKIIFLFEDYSDFGDLINGIYLKMAKFMPPFSYDKKWVIIDEKGINVIQSIINNVKLSKTHLNKNGKLINDANGVVYRLKLNEIENFGIVSGDVFEIMLLKDENGC